MQVLAILHRLILQHNSCHKTVSQLTRCYHKKKNVKKTEHVITLEGGELLFGVTPITMCLEARRRSVHCLYFNPASERAVKLARAGERDGIRSMEMSRSGLDAMCQHVDRYKGRYVHQGILADVSRLHYYPLDYKTPQIQHYPPIPPEPDTSTSAPVWVVLCSVRDPGNLGSIIRTCYYLGVSRYHAPAQL